MTNLSCIPPEFSLAIKRKLWFYSTISPQMDSRQPYNVPQIISEHSDVILTKYSPLKSHISSLNHSKNDIWGLYLFIIILECSKWFEVILRSAWGFSFWAICSLTTKLPCVTSSRSAYSLDKTACWPLKLCRRAATSSTHACPFNASSYHVSRCNDD